MNETTVTALRRRKRSAVWGLVLLLLAGGFAAAWQLTRESRLAHATLDASWTARVRVLAGDGVSGVRDADAGRARFSDPFGIAISVDGMIYVADAGEAQAIRAIAPDGHVFTVAGGQRGYADGIGRAARFNTPSQLALDGAGTLYVADTGNNAIRRITPEGQVSTIAGDGVAGFRDGAAHEARFNGPVGVAVDGNGRVIVADTYNHRVRAIERDGSVHTLAGSGEIGAVDGAGLAARFDTPSGVAVDAAGTIFVADTRNGLVRAIDRAQMVTTLAGRPDVIASPPQAQPEGSATEASPPGQLDVLVRPVGIAASSTGEVYVTDDRGRLVALNRQTGTRTLAGIRPGFHDGEGTDARFRSPTGLALAGPGRLIVADAGNALIRVAAAAVRSEFAPPPLPTITPDFDWSAFAMQPLLWPLAPIDGPHEIAGTLGEARGRESAERFHAGVDVRADEGTLVRAVRDGTAVSVVSNGDFGTLNEWMRIGPLGYVHIRVGRAARGRVPEILDDDRFVPVYDELGVLSRVDVKRGARFLTGEVIGSINRFNHVHLNVGWPGEEHNPLTTRLVQFSDSVPPTIARNGVRVFDEHGAPITTRARGRIVVSGRVRLVVDAWDQVDGNRPNRRLGVFEVGYQVLRPDSSPAPGFEHVRPRIRFDRLNQDPNADFARVVYAPGSGIPFYGRRRTRFLYVATNRFENGVASEDFWDTTLLSPGNYTVRVRVADASGNVAQANRDLPVTIVTADQAPR